MPDRDPSRRRRFRPALLVLGLGFIALGITYLAGGQDAYLVGARIVAPVALIGSGLSVLAWPRT